EHDCEIGNRASERSTNILSARQRDDSRAAGEPLRSTKADKVIVRRGDPNRTARVAPHAGRREVCGDGGTCSAARSAGITVEIERVPRSPETRADGRDAGREL